MQIVIIGCGLGGLSCAISCCKLGLQVKILERAPELLPIGAGIQVPPNAAHVLRYYGLDSELSRYGAVEVSDRVLRRWQDGKLLCVRPGGNAMRRDFGMGYHVIHRADYLEMFLEKAQSMGVEIRLGAEVVDVSTENPPRVTLLDGEEIEADVIVGADGLWSSVRERVLGWPNPPEETGDLAYRGTFSRSTFAALKDAGIDALMEENRAQLWMGPDRHCSFYPVRGGDEFNLVMLRPDDLPKGARSEAGQLAEVRETFEGWDPVIQKMIGCMPSVLKWKLLHMEELSRWVKGRVALLGDACHPSLPYQAQGAAMAVEDGCCLGILLGRWASGETVGNASVEEMLRLYEDLRKSRTTMQVKGSVQNRHMFHLHDGEEQRARDVALTKVNWKDPCPWQWGDINYMTDLYGFDVVADTERALDRPGSVSERPML